MHHFFIKFRNSFRHRWDIRSCKITDRNTAASVRLILRKFSHRFWSTEKLFCFKNFNIFFQRLTHQRLPEIFLRSIKMEYQTIEHVFPIHWAAYDRISALRSSQKPFAKRTAEITRSLGQTNLYYLVVASKCTVKNRFELLQRECGAVYHEAKLWHPTVQNFPNPILQEFRFQAAKDFRYFRPMQWFWQEHTSILIVSVKAIFWTSFSIQKEIHQRINKV